MGDITKLTLLYKLLPIASDLQMNKINAKCIFCKSLKRGGDYIMRMMEILIGIIVPIILFLGSLGVLYVLGNTLSASAMGLVGGIYSLILVWVTSVVLIKIEQKKSKHLDKTVLN